MPSVLGRWVIAALKQLVNLSRAKFLLFCFTFCIRFPRAEKLKLAIRDFVELRIYILYIIYIYIYLLFVVLTVRSAESQS